MVTFDELMNGSEITDEQIRQDSSVKYFVKQGEDETLKYIDVFNYMKEHVVDMVRDFVSLLREKYPVLIAYLSYVVETCIEDDGTIEEIRLVSKRYTVGLLRRSTFSRLRGCR